MAYNNISSIDSKAFSTLNNLTQLDIQNNELTSRDTKLIKGLRNLKEYNLSNNQKLIDYRYNYSSFSVDKPSKITSCLLQ